MYIKRIDTTRFRNYARPSYIQFHQKVNIFLGKNEERPTFGRHIYECYGKIFQNTKDKDLITLWRGILPVRAGSKLFTMKTIRH